MFTLLVLLVLLVVYLSLRCVGARLIFHPLRKQWPLQLPFQKIQFDNCQGVYLPAQNNQPTLLFFHGRGGNISHFEKFAKQYYPYGYGIILFDYRGFGLSKGKPSQKTMAEDALAAVRFALKNLQISPKQLVLFGHSLGNAPALYAAHSLAKLPFKALILQSPFVSTPDMALCLYTHAYHPQAFIYKIVRKLVIPFLFPNLFDNTQLINDLKIPVWLGMSRQDYTIPWQMSHQLARQIKNVTVFISSMGGHDDFDWAAPQVHQFLQQIR